MKKRQQKKMKMFGGVALATFALALILMVQSRDQGLLSCVITACSST